MTRGLLLCVVFFCSAIQAAPWTFEPPLPVTAQSRQGVFVHLESAGRKNIASSAGWVAVSWEDNRDGTPRCYVALKAPGKREFTDAQQVSGKQEAAEPAIVGMEDGRFAVAWEEGEQVWLRTLNMPPAGKTMQLAAPLVLGTRNAAQISLAYAKQAGLFASWSEQGERYWQIQVARINSSKPGQIQVVARTGVDQAAQGDQSYPSMAVLAGGRTMVAWEDRRAGHTRLFYAVSKQPDGYSTPLQLNEAVWNGASLGYGHGTGVMRVALAVRGLDGVAAVWADKRDFQSGYDVYGGFASGVALSFGKNEKVQDEFGNNFAQWHPAIAASASGSVAVAWDDNRDGTPDVWLSWRNANGWSGDLAVPGASGPGAQSDPSIALDEAGNLHLVWIEKETLDSPSMLRYAFGRLNRAGQ